MQTDTHEKPNTFCCICMVSGSQDKLCFMNQYYDAYDAFNCQKADIMRLMAPKLQQCSQTECLHFRLEQNATSQCPGRRKRATRLLIDLLMGARQDCLSIEVSRTLACFMIEEPHSICRATGEVCSVHSCCVLSSLQ